MTIAIGMRLGSYEILSQLGVGGMGEVYRARDSKLNREVALKLLPDAFAQDPERMARFEREAHILASLNHPNIAAIYGLEESSGVRALVMELVEGPTLADRITQGAIPIEEGLPIAQQIAEALEAAHEKGIIHRDLKPANIKITTEGMVKVLDFGLAKAFEGEGTGGRGSGTGLTQSPTLTSLSTQAGIILGTAAYMSPEQARGKAVDRRADIWAFGVLFFEMLAGKPLFMGDTVSDTLASVIKEEPDWTCLPSNLAPGIVRMLRRCLVKDPRQRLRDIGDARLDLTEKRSAATDATPSQSAVSGHLWMTLTGVAIVAAALTAGISWLLLPTTHDLPLRKLTIQTSGMLDSDNQPFVISPEGSRVLYVQGKKLWVRKLDELKAREVVGTGMLATGADGACPFWAPDGKFVGYGSGGKLWKIPADGGSLAALCNLPGNYHGGAWGEADTIVIAMTRGPMFKVPAAGGDPQLFLALDKSKGDVDFHNPTFLPDGRSLLYSVHREQGVDTLELYEQGKRKVLYRLEGQARNGPQVLNYPQYSPSGHILYRRDQGIDGIWAVPFSLSSRQLTGEPFMVVPEGTYPSVSYDGTLVFIPAASSGPRQIVWVNREGKVEGTIGEAQIDLANPVISPDGRRIAYDAREGSSQEIWIYDTVANSRTRLTFSSPSENKTIPAWIPGQNRIAFSCATDQGAAICAKAVDGSGEMEILARKAESPTFSPDGSYMVYVTSGGNKRGLMTLRLTKDSKPEALVETPGGVVSPRISPDGHFVSYYSWEGGEPKSYIRPFPHGEGKWEVPGSTGEVVIWHRNGKALFFASSNPPAMMEVSVETTGNFSMGTPRKLGSLESMNLDMISSFDVHPDGNRFVFVRNLNSGGLTSGIQVVQNWFAEFKNKQKNR